MRIRVFCLLGLVILGCNRRPLSDGRMKLQPDGGATRGDSATPVPDAGLPDAPIVDVPIADAPGNDAPTIGADAADVPTTGSDAADTPPADGPITDVRPDAPAFDVQPDVPAIDVRLDAPLPDVGPPDTGASDRPPDRSSSDVGPPDVIPLDTGGGDTTRPDAGPPPDGGCAGNGLPPQAAPLFAPPVTFPIPIPQSPTGLNATGIGVGDLTGDGRADIVVMTWNPGLIIFPQMPDGTIGVPSRHLLSPAASVGLGGFLEVGDLNGDGRADVVFNRVDGIGFIPGQTTGGPPGPELGPEQLWPGPATGSAAHRMAIADLNGDGRSDLVVMSNGSNGAEVRLQNAAGTLVPSGSYRCLLPSYGNLAIGDANGDGRPDIALASYEGDVCLLLQRTNGDFGSTFSLMAGGQISAVGIGAFGNAFGGMGGCGPAIAFTVNGNRPNSRLGLMTWVQGMPASPIYQDAYDLPEHMAVADVDGDGRQDVVVLHTSWLQVGVFRGAAAGGLAAEELYPFPYINYGLDRLAVGDVNGDGRPDIVSADYELAVLYHR